MNPSSVNTYPTRHLSLIPSGPKPAPTNAAPPLCLTASELLEQFAREESKAENAEAAA